MASEKRLIDANALMERLKFKRRISEVGLFRGLESAMAQCAKAPTVDAVEVVRCENCIHRVKDRWVKCIGRRPYEFCSDGERKFHG